MFHANFEWSCRGKIGGLYIGTGTASGGNYTPDGSSHRLMWGANGDAFSYVYVPEGSHSQQPPALRMRRNYGQGVFENDFRRALSTNRWHHVELGVKLNTVGRADGELMLSIDGKTRVLQGVVWRLANHDIRVFRLNIFHGGGCVATRNSELSFRNIEAREWRD